LFLMLAAAGGLAMAYGHPDSEDEPNPRAEYWREVRGGAEGYTAASGDYTVNSLIQGSGQNWRHLRNGPIATYGGGALLLTIVFFAALFTVRGQVRIEPGPANATVPRWSLFERFLHWYTAILFVVLALTGLSLLFGRALLIPMLGYQGFANWASLSMLVHNFLGPAFMVGVLLMIGIWLKNNIPARYDWEFFKQGGGLLKGKHPHAGKANAGEKLFVYWLGLVVAGTIVCVTGLILDFPNFGQSRETMQLAQTLHSVTSLIWIVLMLGHSYLGSVGIEGAFKGMVSGRVDLNWAKQHNDVWVDKLLHDGITPRPSHHDEGPTGGAPAV
jgi:formate dehydrogenase subunit gamma